MMYTKIITSPSLCTFLRQLSALFGEALDLQHPAETIPGQTTSYVLKINHVEYLQHMGVPQQRRCYPSASSLHSYPLSLRVDIIHPGASLSFFQNGSVVPFFSSTSGDASGRVGIRIGYSSPPSRFFPGTSPQQRHLASVLGQRLEHLLATASVTSPP